ncbi:MAG: 4Fe-4S binding protein [Ilumatobacteraceae bacterium]
MSYRVAQDLCIGCGACDFSCHADALRKTDAFLGLFEIDPLTCDDCGVCVAKCPEEAIVPDPEWPVCRGHGCPLSSRRLSATVCAVWQRRCPTCGYTTWSTDGETWSCPKCDEGRKVSCPRSHLVDAG